MPVVVLVLGIMSLALLVATDWIRQRLVEPSLLHIRALDRIETAIAISHLWVEEHVTGDEVDMEEVWRNLDEASSLVAGLIEGGQIDDAGGRLEPLSEPRTRHHVRELSELIEQFAAMSHQRHSGFARGEEVGIGSAIDRRYDAVFFRLRQVAEELRSDVAVRSAANARRASLLYRAILLSWIVIVVIAVTGLWTRERRRVLAEKKLEESRALVLQGQKMEAVGRLAGGIAHDINNYLGAIASQCELVQMQEEPGSKAARKLETAISTVFKASALIKQLLAFSKKQPAELAIVDLNEVVRGLEPMMRQLIGEDIRLNCVLADDLGLTRVDPAQIEQVVVNLLVNAREAMPTGGLVTIETANLPGGFSEPGALDRASEEQVTLTVSDDGPGIPPEIRDKIFEPFFSTKAGSGTGLGLATAYGIVEQYGGRLRVHSELGHGATFKVFLPRTLGETAGEAHARQRSSELPAGSERILLVEDNPELRLSSSTVLEELGYRVSLAADGPEALELVQDLGADIALVVTDVVMPGMSGRELADQIASRLPQVGFLFVSGYTDDVVLRHGVLAGEVDFLQKPFSTRALAKKVREILDRPVAD